jgi:hypothetical protein
MDQERTTNLILPPRFQTQTEAHAGPSADPLIDDRTLVKIKWLGHPPIWYEGGTDVGDWAWENKRVIPIPGHQRVIGTEHLPGLSQPYAWWGDALRRIQIMKAHDARLVLEACPLEFYDVTYMTSAQALAFEHDAIFVPRPGR